MQPGEFESVLSAAQAGAEWAWDHLYREHAGRVLGYLRGHGAADAENLLGEVFLQLARNVAQFTGDETAFRSWVFTIAYHRLLDERRLARRRPADPVAAFPDYAVAADDDTADAAVAAVHSAQLKQLIDRLAPAQREVLLLRIHAGFTVAEVAEVTRRTEGAVKALQRRGVEALRRLLDREGVPL